MDISPIGQPLFPQVFVRKGEVPPLTQVSVADFKSGGYFEAHDHEDMFERLGIQNTALHVHSRGTMVYLHKGQ